MNTVSKVRFWMITVVLMGLVLLVLAWMGNRWYLQTNIDKTAARLQLLSELRRDALASYLDTAKAELKFWSTGPTLTGGLADLLEGMEGFRSTTGDPAAALQQAYIVDNPFPYKERARLVETGIGSSYDLWHQAFHPIARRFVSERGYYDFFLISTRGEIYYSVEKEADFATSLADGPWMESGLGEVWRRAMDHADAGIDAVVLSDLERYEPSLGEPAMFIGMPMFADSGALLGVIALQLPTDEIEEIMDFRSGMGETGETYVVSEQRLMLSNSRFERESTILAVTVDTETVNAALAGNSGVAFVPDYRGVEVLSAYTALDLDTHRWAIMAEMDRQEILQWSARNAPGFGGLVLFFYVLGLGSVWVLSNAPDEKHADHRVDMDFDAELPDG